MFTNEEAEALLKAEKYLENPNQALSLGLDKLRIDLFARDLPEYTFFIEVVPNRRIQFKMTLHCQEKHSSIGLLRIDYKGSHYNPNHALETLPNFLKPYLGMEFRREAHIHFYVAGYKPLAWAMPLRKHTFQIKELTCDSDYAEVLTNFAKLLNVQSRLNIQTAIIQ